MRSLGLDLDRARIQVESVANGLDLSEIEWVSQNRDIAETQRYDDKDSVDTSLKNSETVSSERRAIEAVFDTSTDPVVNIREYLALLRRRMRALETTHLDALRDLSSATLGQVWTSLCFAADIDNAHAMYLSSDNWPFSVFNQILDQIEEFTENDDSLMAPILTGGVVDVRTATWGGLGQNYIGLTREQFVAEVIKSKDWVRDDGVAPLVSFESGSSSRPSGLPELEDTRARFESAVGEIRAGLSPTEVSQFQEIVDAYCALYNARLEYDTYEYFGPYAVIRHALILKSIGLLQEQGLDSDSFREAATTYQFDEIRIQIRSWH